MTVLVTGCAGFIGMHVAEALLSRGDEVIGVDDLNAYYDPALKQARLLRLEQRLGFRFVKADISDVEAMAALAYAHAGDIDGVVHLAAQAGVRWSLQQPLDYLRSNLAGHLVLLETVRHQLPNVAHTVYASSSAVYGASTKVPFGIDDPADAPVSLYAATKRADELIARAYAHLYGLPLTGLRFFTVYGPWGRPDMAYYAFADAILAGRPITLFNEGRMQRDFTFIDDITAGVLACLDRPPVQAEGEAPHRLLNLGGHHPVQLLDFVRTLEAALGQAAEIRLAPMQPGDVPTTYADISATTAALGWRPEVGLEEGLARFVAWHRGHHARG